MDHYTIRIKEQLTQHWSEWCKGLTITMMGNGETILSGSLPDQAALHGLLERIRDLNLTLILVSLDKAGEVSGDNFDEYRTKDDLLPKCCLPRVARIAIQRSHTREFRIGYNIS